MALSLGLHLGLGSIATAPRPQPTAADTVCGAIHNLHQIAAARGNKDFVLAPHVIYWKASRPEELWLDAVVISENGSEPNKPKLKSFELADLEGIEVLQTSFEPFVGLHADDPEYAGKTRCIVQTV
jgi:hypothetical protein